ncbi:MAG: tetratricopeptide repeat protein [Alphaproteobacteria bacterium]
MRRLGWIPAATLLLCTSLPAHADYQDGLVAHHNGEFAEARSEFEAVAETDPRAAVALGIMAARGDGMDQDMSEAAVWFGRAAEAGDANGQYHLARLHYAGKGVAQDKARAVELFGLSAEQSHVGATQALSLILENGDGVPADAKRAFELALANAEAGVPRDQLRTARMLAEGQGIEADPGRAYFYAALAARTGLADAFAVEETYAAKLTETQLAEQKQNLLEWRPTGQK